MFIRIKLEIILCKDESFYKFKKVLGEMWNEDTSHC